MVPPEGAPVGALGEPAIDRGLEEMSAALRGSDYQATGFLALTPGRQFASLRQVVITKVVAMPEMSGDQAAEVIKQLRPELPVIMLTGLGALIEVTGARPRAVDAVIGKPVTIATLRQTLAKFRDAA